MKAIHVVNPGKKARLKIGETKRPSPGPNQLLVKVEATALNRADLHQKGGKYPPPEGASEILGLEMAGIVEETGEQVTRLKPGDFVFGLLPGGGYAEFCVIHERLAMPLPESLSFVQAAAIPETFLTAYQALNWLGGLTRSETVLIHAGGSGVGTAAIQLAHHLVNARVVTTAGKQRKLEAALKLGANYAFNYRKADWAEAVEDELGKNAVNLVVDFIGAPYWEQNMRVLAMDGRLVYLSFLGGHKLKKASLGALLRKRLTLTGSTLRNRPESYKIKLTSEFADHTLDLFEQEVLRPVVDRQFDWSEADEAHRYMADDKNTGKIVLTGM
ncbi:MAG: NAD(P)H-quinone oxidoreductase [Balneolaceae bacterium]|nr:NAD(P)H-quinone oxidoreductase [Balneolaceae bacterium]